MERFINILIIDSDERITLGLKSILMGSGNNLLTTQSIQEAIPIITKKEIGIILINLDDYNDQMDVLKTLKTKSSIDTTYIILIVKDTTAIKLVKGLKLGAVDYIQYPFNPNLVKSKIEVFKTIYFKDQRIGQLLSNIFPENVLSELAGGGKFSPKRIDHGVVMFTDFVDFSTKAKEIPPIKLIKKLEGYFTKFDEIIEKYRLEKIKTIGDSYMALAGVTEKEPLPAVRACLAALELRHFMQTNQEVAKALKKEYWEIRIGIHIGPLVAGIIGDKKYSFDIWGDTVNIASRAETVSGSGKITITQPMYEEVKDYFEAYERGSMEIEKRGGLMDMYYLESLRPEFRMSESSFYPSSETRVSCGLESMDFNLMRIQIINRLKSLLPENLLYHDIPHTLNVEKAVMRYGKLEGISQEEMFLLRTAALFHDAGFIINYHNNEVYGAQIAESLLPNYGYSENQIDTIKGIIIATQFEIEPKTLLEKIMCDADHDYLGRPDYQQISRKLRQELAVNGDEFGDEEWLHFQLAYLEEKHKFYTDTAVNLRQIGKENRINDLRTKLQELNGSE